MKKIINIYLVKEITSPFLIGLSIFSFIFLMSSILKLAELVVNKGVRITDILKLIIYVMPSFLVFTIPMSLLMAVLTALGRLSGDNEITAMKASGINPYGLIVPVMTISLICYVLTSLVAIYAVPKGNYSYSELIFNIVRNRATIGIKERVFNSDFGGLVIYVNEMAVRGKKLKGVLVSESGENKDSHTIFAREGYVISDTKSLVITLRLIDGDIHGTGRDLVTYQKIGFSTYDINLDLGAVVKEKGASKKKYIEMSIYELQREIKQLKEKERDFYRPLGVLYKRFSLPFACLVFGLIAVPLGIQSRPSGKLWGFILSLGVIIAYYVLLTGGEILAKSGQIPLSIALWTPNFFLGIVGVYMLHKMAKEQPFVIITWIKKISSKVALSINATK